jgi:hypothetical protein
MAADSADMLKRTRCFFLAATRPSVYRGVFRTCAARRGHPSPSSFDLRHSATRPRPSPLVRRRCGGPSFRRRPVAAHPLSLRRFRRIRPARPHRCRFVTAGASPSVAGHRLAATVAEVFARRRPSQGTSPLLVASSAAVHPGNAPGVPPAAVKCPLLLLLLSACCLLGTLQQRRHTHRLVIVRDLSAIFCCHSSLCKIHYGSESSVQSYCC